MATRAIGEIESLKILNFSKELRWPLGRVLMNNRSTIKQFHIEEINISL